MRRSPRGLPPNSAYAGRIGHRNLGNSALEMEKALRLVRNADKIGANPGSV